MNDSAYGLTRVDLDRATSTPRSPSATEVETGTWFMNRCDYLDPALAWTGVKRLGSRLHPLDARLRAAHTTQVVPPPDGVVTIRVSLLECDHVDDRHRGIDGDYADMFSGLLARAGAPVELVRYDVCRGVLPASARECDAWLAAGSRRSVYDDEDWIGALVGPRAGRPP